MPQSMSAMNIIYFASYFIYFASYCFQEQPQANEINLWLSLLFSLNRLQQSPIINTTQNLNCPDIKTTLRKSQPH